MKSSVIIVIELWCCGLVALMEGIKRLSLLAESVKKVGWKSLLVDEKRKREESNGNP